MSSFVVSVAYINRLSKLDFLPQLCVRRVEEAKKLWDEDVKMFLRRQHIGGILTNFLDRTHRSLKILKKNFSTISCKSFHFREIFAFPHLPRAIFVRAFSAQ